MKVFIVILFRIVITSNSRKLISIINAVNTVQENPAIIMVNVNGVIDISPENCSVKVMLMGVITDLI